MDNESLTQMSIFDFMYEKKVITKPIRLIEFFAGIGAQYQSLKFLLANKVESYKICEWAVPSIAAYNAIHIKDQNDYSKDKTKEELIDYLKDNVSTDYNKPCDVKKKPESWLRSVYNNCIATRNLMNVMKVHGSDLEIVDTDKYEYICTYSFPCQDLSLAGKRKLMSVSQAEGGTRSGLLWEIERILDELERERGSQSLPQILLMENVPAVAGKGAVRDFEKFQAKLESLGYKNYVQILNAKDYGIPQNRRRCFMISILGDYSYSFPAKIKLERRLKDMLEDDVDKKYTISDQMLKYLTAEDTGKYKRKQAFETCLRNTNEKGITVALSTRQARGWCDNYILVKNKTKQGYLVAEDGDGVDISTRMHYHRGTVQKNICQTITCMGGENVGVVIDESIKKIGNYGNGHHAKDVFDTDGVSPTITTGNHGLGIAIAVENKKG